MSSSEKIRVLIVDDSTVTQKMIAEVFSGNEAIEVVGTAKDGRDGIEKIDQLKPDVITLDMEMPLMDGLDMLREMRKKDKTLPAVIFFSHVTEAGAEITLEALEIGAQDFVTKPNAFGNYHEVVDMMRKTLLQKVVTFGKRAQTIAQRRVQAASGAPAPSKAPVAGSSAAFGAAAGAGHAYEVVALGGSTPAPPAVQSILSKLPADFPLPVVVTVHLPPLYSEFFAKKLDNEVALTVVEADEGMQLAPGHVYIAPGNRHLELARAGKSIRIRCTKDDPLHDARPSIDKLFFSLAKACGRQSIGVILTGVGKDGVEGCESIRKANGTVIAQDEESSLVWGTPGAVVEAGNAADVIGIADIADRLLQYAKGKAAA